MFLLLTDLKEVVQIDPTYMQLVLRGTGLYFLLLFLIQFLRYHTNPKFATYTSSFSEAVFVVIVLLFILAKFYANISGYITLPNILILTAILAFWNFLFNLSSNHYSFVNKIVLPPPLLLVKNGKTLRIHMWWGSMTRDKLTEKLQEQGISDLSSLKRVFMEPGGNLVVLEK